MNINNKNIFSNLNSDEEIVYIAQKNKLNFWIDFITITFFILPIIAFFDLVSIFKYNIFGTVWMQILMFTILPFCLYMIYEIIINYYFTDIVITNQRFIFSRMNKIYSINNSEIIFIFGTYSFGNNAKSTTIKLKDKRCYRFLFVDKDKIISKLKELPTGYDDSEIIAKNKKNAIIILMILLISLPVTLFFEIKLIKPKIGGENNVSSNNTIKHSKNKEDSYFDPYMKKLQVKIKKNWQQTEKAEKSKIVVKFKIMSNGSVKNLKIIKSSNNSASDAAAINAILLAAPFDPLPKQHKENSADIIFTFDLK